VHEPPERRGEAAAEERRGARVEVVGHGDQVDVGVVQRDQLREGSPVREARLGLVPAHLAVPGPALGTPAARADERHGDAVADAEAGDLGARRVDPPDELVAGNLGERDAVVVPEPAVRVAAADARGLDADDDAARGRDGIGQLADDGRLAEPLVDDGAHGGSSGSGEGDRRHRGGRWVPPR
jgi:hypothetical protein